MDSETYVKLTAQVLGLPIPPEYLSGTVANFARVATMAAQVLEFPLQPDIEPACIFSLEHVPAQPR